MRKIYLLDDTKDRLKRVLQTIQATITATMGPVGRTNILYNGSSLPHITKDGVTVAEFLKFETHFEEAINKIVKETAQNTGHKVGDGTTTSILLATELIIQLLELDKIDFNILQKDVTFVIKTIKALTKNLNNFNNSEQLDILSSIIKLSSNNDAEIINLLSDVLEKIGPNGLIDVSENIGEETFVDLQDGILIDAPALVTKTQDVINPVIVLVSDAINNVHEFKSCMHLANKLYMESKTPMIVIAKEFSQDIQNIVTINNRNTKFDVYLSEGDGFAYNAFEILDDMALLLDCKVLSIDIGSDFSLQNIKEEYIAQVKSATISPQQTILYNDDFLNEKALNIKQELEKSIAELKSKASDKIGELAQLERRLSKYSKSAVIKVGGNTEAEKLERKDRVDDAVQAVHSAVNNGVVPGGGSTLYLASKGLKSSSIIKTICTKPVEVLTKQDIATTLKLYDSDKVIDFNTLKTGDPYKLGILDPADVAIKALQQALVVAKTILGSYSLIIDTPDEV